MPPRISLFPKCYFDELADGRRSLRGLDPRGRRRSAAKGSSITTASSAASPPADVDPIARGDGGDRPDHLDDLLLARLHASRCRRATAAGRAAEGGHRSHRAARRAHLPHAQRPAASRACRARTASRARSTASALARVRRAPRRRAVHGEPLQGRHLALSGVRAARGHLPRDPRSRSTRRTSAFSTIRRTRSSAATIRSRFLEKVKHRVVTMHASDRYLAPGATLDDLATGDGAHRLRRGS